MAYREAPQPDADCCLGGYCWRQFCPDKNAMRRYMVKEALRRDTGRVLETGCGIEVPELDDEDRE